MNKLILTWIILLTILLIGAILFFVWDDLTFLQSTIPQGVSATGSGTGMSGGVS